MLPDIKRRKNRVNTFFKKLIVKTENEFTPPKRALSIAGAESGGTAGIHADLKTFQEIGVYGMTVITAIVGRHPKTNKNVHPISMEAIEAQFATALTRVGVDGLKTGMLFSKEVINRVAGLLQDHKIPRPVVDPVMIGKLDSKLLHDDAIEEMKRKIFPLAKVITPNMMEASVLLKERKVKTMAAVKQAAVDLYDQGPENVIVKGGRLDGPAVDVLYDGRNLTCFEVPRVPTKNTSGAGDSYSAAIAAYLAQGYAMKEAVRKAKQFVTAAIIQSFTYTQYPGPANIIDARKKSEAVAVKMYS